MERREIRFEGRVQGVFFRATTKESAKGFDVTGWVRNEPDGSVLAQIQGEPGEIERFLEHHRAVRPGRIDRETAREIRSLDDETGFVVTR